MGAGYKAIAWTAHKKRYDAIMVIGLAIYLGLFISASFLLRPDITIETAMVRAFSTAALICLHIVLSIGPLCRFDKRFLPLLYNRRHLGVTTFILALAHAALAFIQFHAFGSLNPLVSLFVGNTRFDSISQFPFQPLGFAALVILFLMAATSHDFWLTNLTAPVWKALHMLVYVAYASVVLHVALGILQAETGLFPAALLVLGMLWILGLHLAAALKESRRDRRPSDQPDAEGFVDVCSVAEIPEKEAQVFVLSGERVAVFRYDGKVSAVSNVCRHQNGPLGEGRVVDGCITCPWHGYQYLPENGQSPPPFDERIETFRVRIEGKRVWVHPDPNPPGTRVEPALIATPAEAT